MTHKGTSDLQKIEREKRQRRREEIREQAIMLQRRKVARVTEHEGNPPESGHDQQEEGVTNGGRFVDRVVRSSPTGNTLGGKTFIFDKSKYLNVGHYEEDLRLRDGEFGIWSRLDDEVNDDNHLVIR